MSDTLIFGKNNLQKVVSIEVSDGHAEVFVKQDDGSTKSVFIENKLWLLSNEKHKGFIRLKGDLHYKFGKQFQTKREFNSTKGKLKHNKSDIYTIGDLREQCMVNKGISYHRGLNPKDLSVLSFDIETTGLKHDDNSRVLLIANTFRNSKGEVSRKMFCYDQYEDEGKMIEHWCNWLRKVDPDVLVAHNGISYDLPYIRFIADKYNVSLDLGRDKSRLEFQPFVSKFRVDGSREQEYTNVRCYGREIYDTCMASIRWDIGKKLESYNLKNIIKQLNLDVENRQYYDAATIKDNYKNPIEWEKIKKYAEFDGDEALQLFDLTCTPFFYMNQIIPKTFQQMILSASGSQINSIMVRSYLQEGHSIPKADEIKPFPGAISYGIPGKYSNAIRYDFAAMYPSIILEFNVYNKEKDPNKNFLKIAQYIVSERLKNKKLAKETGQEYYSHIEQTFKILANSFYGFLSSNGLNFNYPEGAEFITTKGRELLQFCIKHLTGKQIEDYGYIQTFE